MKTLLVSTADFQGGAARAAYRLHQGLQEIGVDSQMLVQYKSTDDLTVTAPRTRLGESVARTRVAFDALPLKFYPQREDTIFSLQWLPERTLPKIAQLKPDIINLHWTGEAFLQIETIAKLKTPLVWTLHDMWAFTGGCHYNQDCDRYTDACGKCPQLGSSKDRDLSRWVWQRKAKAWRNLDLTIVALSSWLAKCVKSSSLFKELRVELIPNGIDTNLYRPINPQIARELLKLPQDKHLVLFGSLKATSNNRKGFHLLQPALQDLSKSGWQDRVELVVFGSSQPENPPEFGLKTHYLGTFSDDLSLALVYSAADVFVLPSVQDNLPNTIMEAIACGTPCVAFNIGGMPDMIEHQKNGYLVEPYRIEDLARGIAWVLENRERHQNLSRRARDKVEQEFTRELQASRYLSLFTEILEGGNR
ncbi:MULTISPECIES: glycosyltransferase family 4 protein [unclassified Coleofasciculus]|uniref:glycosyltransferase family 4 protein n=1 Tax=unclassified Coleofasciculus TaxID=2692782 RepID=UPI001880B3D9|nr:MULTISPECIES: glycosyltransferase family 4 protein [unclassified Coleofasciculus]MBE9125338.1 glycosyltransferase family 4 protein [Coleofasciculus sp. LEGE 07081]MBE9148541.1 glycosyltransferase family 4 protein [Coleofasciculus sp. LEGE 07092]